MKLYGWFGLLLLIASEYCLFRKIEPVHTWFYCFAWWSYILIADNLLLKLSGRSLLTSRRREFWTMLPISVFIWLLFESYNFIINNWAYNSLPEQIWQRWPGYALSFATVLPGIFITSDLMGFFLGVRSAPTASECEHLAQPPSSRPSRIYIVLGLILTVAPLIWPRYFFAAVWLGPIFLLDPLLEKIGIKSLSLNILSKDRRRLWSLMLGGFICGLMWEFWNFWAGSKWIYTVPYFGKWKLFEMPILGFLGFIPFALECWILYHLLRAIPRHMHSSAARIAWWLGIGIICLIIFHGIDKYTVISVTGYSTSKLLLCFLS
jgi:hypothetical protein